MNISLRIRNTAGRHPLHPHLHRASELTDGVRAFLEICQECSRLMTICGRAQVLAGTFSRPLPTADAILAGGGSVDAIPLPSPVEVPAPANA